MPNDERVFYWDSCVFLNVIDASPQHINTLRSFLEEVQNNSDDIIVTSAIAKVEVAFTSYEKTAGALDPQAEANIDALWNDPSVVELIDFNDDIAVIARDLMREAITRGWSLKPNDAIHLASARWMGNITEFHTYDDLSKYASLIGCDICEPYILQPRLIND
jgi:predicted nucleic acid-binding protein